ncbi:MAG: hypothetical protein A2X56_11440 [Nitrospirae bacterium GWC2_57_13]|jgi:hypothetical protein|nr:MAG: hypothetical protein A2X56_11440 [Nitrospirae bacterium GWC2_57_13]
MKVFDVREKLAGSGEYILGAKETGSHACYLIYGVMGPGEKGRELKAGHGHEEIILALVGDLHLNGQHGGVLKQGQAMHIAGDESVQVDNRTGIEAVYVISGGHSGGGHHER